MLSLKRVARYNKAPAIRAVRESVGPEAILPLTKHIPADWTFPFFQQSQKGVM